MFELALGVVEAAKQLIDKVARFFDRKIPGASVIDLMAAEGFFVLSEAVPGVVWVVGSGNTPEIEKGSTVGFSIENHLDKKNSAGHKFAMSVISGSVGVITNAVVIIN